MLKCLGEFGACGLIEGTRVSIQGREQRALVEHDTPAHVGAGR
jgi:hypothetical protein